MGFFDRGSAPSKTTTSRTPAPSGGGKSGRIDYRDPALNGPFYPGTTRQEFRDDPNWRYQHTPGSDRASHTGYKPSVSPKTPWVEPSAEWYAQDEAAQAQRRSEREGQEAQIPGYAEAKAAWEAAKASGDPRATSTALKRALDIRTKGTLQLKDQRALDAFIAQGGTEETYRDRFNRDWPKPKSPLGAYSHGPGSKDWDTRFDNPPPPNTIGASTGDRELNMPSSGRTGGAGGIQGFLGGALTPPPPDPHQGVPEWAQGQGGATTGQSDVLAALSRLQGMPLGAPTAATGAPGGFARAASAMAPAMAAAKKPTMVRRGGGQVDMR